MARCRFNILSLAGAVALAAALAGCREVPVDVGKSVIVSGPKMRAAAEELQRNLRAAYGENLPIVETAPAGAWTWNVGTETPAGLGPEEGRWTIGKRGVSFAGKGPDGVYNAVCDFLEEEIGVRWPWGGEIAVPANPPRAFREKTGGWAPKVLRREIRTRNDAYATWRRRLGFGEHDAPSLGHAFTQYWSRFSKTDPEIFAMRKDGARVPTDAPANVANAAAYTGNRGCAISMCVSSDRLVELVVKDWRKNGRPEYVNVCENDAEGKNACHCPKCEALDVKPDPPEMLPWWRDCYSDRYINFAKRVLAEVRKERPDAKVSFYAYNATERAPRRERLVDGLVPGLVATRFDHPSLKAYLKSWNDRGLTAFVYRPNRHLYYHCPYLPLGNERHFFDNLQIARAAGAIGFDYDCAYDQQHDAPLDWFADYVLFKAMKDPSKDFAHWERHYMRSFGAAGDDVAAYFRYWRENIWEKKIEKDIRRLTDEGKWWFFNRGLLCGTDGKGHLAEYYAESDFDATDAILARALARRGLSAAERARVQRFVDANVHARLFFRAVTEKCEKNARALRDFRERHGLALTPWYEDYYGDICGIRKLPLAEKAPARHHPKVIMGKDYWPVLYKYGDWCYNADVTNVPTRCHYERCTHREQKDIYEIPAFRDVVPAYYARRQPTDGMKTFRHFANTFRDDEPDRELLTANPHPDRPLLFWATGKRNFQSWGDKPDLVAEEYRTWKKAHPNLMYDGVTVEWDNDLMLAYNRVAKLPEGPRKETIAKFLGARPKDRYARVAKMREYMNDRRAASYGGDMYTLAAHIYDLNLAADAGAKYLCLETTNSSGGPKNDSEYRWNVAAMFTRGAVRQFQLPWEWYIAGYMNGFTSDGRWLGNIINIYPGRDATPDNLSGPTWCRGAECGQSGSILRRAFYFAYLSGANFTQMEEWTAQFLMWDRTAKKMVVSPRGKKYIEYHNFTQAHPNRGVAYTPVAICVPLAQGYQAYGGYPFGERTYGYTEGDHAVDAIFHTLVPGFERAKAMARGEEHNLHNTPYAAMYDAITLDVTAQTQEELLDVLKSYKAIVIVGDYRDRGWEKTVSKYEQAGGRVIRIGADQVPKMTKNADATIADLRAGRAKYPKLAEIFRGLQKDYFPFAVQGDCLYGANRNSTGWWLWVFNNNGVTKFGDKPEVIDASKASKVSVTFPVGTGRTAVRELLSGKSVPVRSRSFSWTVPAGDLAIFEIK